MTDNHRQFFSIFLSFPFLPLSHLFSPFPFILKFINRLLFLSPPFAFFLRFLYLSLFFLSFFHLNKYNIRNSAIRLNVRIILFPTLSFPSSFRFVLFRLYTILKSVLHFKLSFLLFFRFSSRFVSFRSKIA